jgi:hypothetical protein
MRFGRVHIGERGENGRGQGSWLAYRQIGTEAIGRIP